MARAPRRHKGRMFESGYNRAGLSDRTKAIGENGAYRDSEKLARKIEINGPEYYLGSQRKIAHQVQAAEEKVAASGEYKDAVRQATMTPTCSISFSDVSQDDWDSIFGKKGS